MTQPTDAQIKEFWEWCGFKQLDKGNRSFHYERGQRVMDWMPPDKEEWFESVKSLPGIDLNNLFRYAVPKLGYRIRAITIYPPIIAPPVCDKCYMEITLCDGQTIESIEETPALALFWAIWEIIK